MGPTSAAPRHRDALPQLDRPLFLTDGGIETTLIFHEGLDLPHFAAYDLLAREGGEDALRRYFEPYVAIALERGVGIVLETPTWRASPDWARLLGHSPAAAGRSQPSRRLPPCRDPRRARDRRHADRRVRVRRPTR